MKKEQDSPVRYYLIRNRIAGKKDGEEYYIFRHGQWEPDEDYMIMDRLMGYDPSEPPGSPYGIGNMDIMDEIEEISPETAMRYTGGTE